MANFYSGRSLKRVYTENDDTFKGAAAVKKRLDSVFSRIASLPASAIRDTIFCRKPVLFSLLLVLDENPVAIVEIKGVSIEVKIGDLLDGNKVIHIDEQGVHILIDGKLETIR